MTERKQNRRFMRYKMPIADIQPFAVNDLARMGGKIFLRRTISERQRKGFGQLAAGRYLAEHQIAQRTRSGLTCQINLQHSWNSVDPRHFDRRSVRQYNSASRISFGNRRDKRIKLGGLAQMPPIKAFGLKHGWQADHYDYLIGGFGMTVLSNHDIYVVPVRAGVGARLGVNIGYLKFTDQPTWNPF